MERISGAKISRLNFPRARVQDIAETAAGAETPTHLAVVLVHADAVGHVLAAQRGVQDRAVRVTEEPQARTAVEQLTRHNSSHHLFSSLI